MKKYIGLITTMIPLVLSAQLVMNGNYSLIMSGGSMASPVALVVTNSTTAGITNNGTGCIYSENEYNMVQWNIATHTGSYVVPFGYNASTLIPVTCNIVTAGTGTGGNILFSTWHCPTWDNTLHKPSDVVSMSDFGSPDYSNNAVDRFWVVDAKGFTTKPKPDITFTYIRSGAYSEIAAPNYIKESFLVAQRYNSTTNVWDDFTGATGMDVISGSTGTVASGDISAVNFYRSWMLANDSTLLGIPAVYNETEIIAYPNPSNGNFTVSGLKQGQSLEIYNEIGQELGRFVAYNTTMQLNISDKANGMYLVRILNKDGSFAEQKKIVKMQ